jgi:hypothetical protein
VTETIDAGPILRKINFNYDRTDFLAVEIDLSRNVSTSCARKHSGASTPRNGAVSREKSDVGDTGGEGS